MFNIGDKVISITGFEGVIIGNGKSKSVYHVLISDNSVIAYDAKFLCKVEDKQKEEKKVITKTKKSSKKKVENDK